MNFTNKYNLPKPLVSMLSKDYYSQSGNISITGLIQPPRIYQLRKRHKDEIEIDISEKIWAVLGSSVHSLLERIDIENIITEERFSYKGWGWKITGIIDLYEEPATITDYKITSVWACINGIKKEWEQQLNLYAFLYLQAGFKVNKLQIIAILRDWSKNRAKQEGDYPPCQIKVMPVNLWRYEEMFKFLEKRVALHQDHEKLSDNELLECTSEERWDKPETWAIKKEGRKSAIKILYSIKEVNNYILNNKEYIEYRPGKRTRCEEYCEVNNFCNYYLKYLADINDKTKKG